MELYEASTCKMIQSVYLWPWVHSCVTLYGLKQQHQKVSKPLKRNPAAMFNKIITSWRTAPDGKKTTATVSPYFPAASPEAQSESPMNNSPTLQFRLWKRDQIPQSESSFIPVKSQWCRYMIWIKYIYIYDMNHIYIIYIIYNIYDQSKLYTHIYIYYIIWI